MKPEALFIPRIELKAKRLREKFTSGELACMSGVNRTTIERWENGTRDMVSESFVKLLHTLGFKIISNEEYTRLSTGVLDKNAEVKAGELLKESLENEAKGRREKRAAQKIDGSL